MQSKRAETVDRFHFQTVTYVLLLTRTLAVNTRWLLEESNAVLKFSVLFLKST
jgi:hypothetical protein